MGEILKVKMLGGFSVTYGETPVIKEQSRESKATSLFRYLLANRDRIVPQEELIEVLLGDDDSANPLNVLKNLAYRARKLLTAAGLPEKEYIYAKSGGYGFTSSLPCQIDVEQFYEHWELARNTRDGEKLSHYLRAIALYGGDFLPRAYSQTWVMSRTVKYQGMYRDCVEQAFSMLCQREDYEQALQVADRAVTLYPYEEFYRLLYIFCLYQMGRTREAVSEYESTTAMLFDELGVEPSEEMRALYHKITGSLEHVERSLDDILSEIIETEDAHGAYYCNYQVFINTFRFVVRHIQRNGDSAFVALCTFTDQNGDPLPPEKLKAGVQAYHNAIACSLRRSDIYTRYSKSQFLVLLMKIDQENCRMVMGRIANNFRRFCRDKDIKMAVRYTSALAKRNL